MKSDAGPPAGQAGGWDAEAVRARLGELALRDPEFTRFGSDEHRYRLTPPLPEAALRAFEERYAVRLPDSYRTFLARVGGSGAGPQYGLLPLDESLPVESEDAVDDLREQDRRPGFLAAPFPLCGEWRGSPAERFDEEAERARVAGSLVIAESGCGEFVRLVVTGPSAGQVWFDDMTWAHIRPGPGFRDWYLAWLLR
ncbi:SMI1/KNR4 family protein [Streptomyces sp. ID38640]|uniref:SMI1/KNR4 family protein n=1 Tax=Streptomyces sp. ID38640 TaxID=1265399 RepID=UPI00140F30B1|nr:SMI1/KNR4 family protein [Streptomyces sp. ID38640]QIK04926.1 SMI1/KNR4 family protein [Streptomyces sp. ID38640]